VRTLLGSKSTKSDRSSVSRTPRLERLEARRLLAYVNFSQPYYVASTLSGTAMITLTNDDAPPYNEPPYGGSTATVELSTSDGTAKAGVDYEPVDQTVTIPDHATVSIPLLSTASTGPDKTVNLSLSDPSNPPSASTNTAVLYLSPTSDTTAPTVSRVGLQTTGHTITGVVLTFSEPMDPGPVQNVQNYFLYKDLQQTIGAGVGPRIPITSAVYNASAQTVTLTPASPLPARTLHEITFNQYYRNLGIGITSPSNDVGVIPSPITDTAGVPLFDPIDGLLDGTFTVDFASGTTLKVIGVTANFARNGTTVLSYTPDGSAATLKLTGGGTMDLISSGNSWYPAEVQIIGPTRRTVLSGHGVSGMQGPVMEGPTVVSPVPIKVHLNPKEFPPPIPL
jgi:Calx-beta domain/Bacterial Ig-like domain